MVLTAKGLIRRSPKGSSGLHTSTESKDNYCLKSGEEVLHLANECAIVSTYLFHHWQEVQHEKQPTATQENDSGPSPEKMA